MLIARPVSLAGTTIDMEDPAAVITAETRWLDLIDPSDREREIAARLIGLRVPSFDDLSEIESSSRVYWDGPTLYMSMPLARRREHKATSAPVGFVLSDRYLLTIRFTDYPSFDTYAAKVESGREPLAPNALLVGLLEAIVDRSADVLEMIARDLDEVGTAIFHPGGRRNARSLDQAMRGQLGRVGKLGDTLAIMRDTLLGLVRITNFFGETLNTEDCARLRARIDTIGRDIRSLSDFDAQLSNKVQFLLDATLGFINIQQNNGIRILTVVSIIGIPPTLIASIYGMNFKVIPELNWQYGYYYALVLMLLSVVLPLAWFRRVGWI